MTYLVISRSSSEDNPARELQQALADHGVSAWIHLRELTAGIGCGHRAQSACWPWSTGGNFAVAPFAESGAML